jgi:tetratricopeptide (TPR) repeat protein
VEAAVEDFRQAKRLEAQTAGPARAALHQHGRAAYQKGDYVLAEHCCTGAIEIDGTEAALWFARGRARLKQAEAMTDGGDTLKWNKAFGDFTEANRLRPGDGATLACQAYCMGRLKDFEGAIEQYDRALQAGYPPARLLTNRARCLLLSPQKNNPLDKSGRVRADLDAALRQEPGLRAALCNRGVLILNQWMLDRQRPLDGTAIADLKQAAELGPPNGKLFELAALATAAAAAQASLADWDDWKGQTLGYLDRAFAFGQNPQRLTRYPVLADLISAEEFTALSQGKVPAKTDTSDRLWWADPVGD